MQDNQDQHMKPQAILFDWDNTLADTWPTIYEALSHTFQKMGRTPWTLEETKERVHRSLRDSFPAIFGQDWEKAGELYLTTFKAIHLDKLSVIDGAEEMLKALSKTDIYRAVVSNKTGYNLRAEVTHLGWDKYFHKTIGAKDAPRDKPSPDPVYMALEGSHIIPSKKVWFIGDSVTDLECAHNSDCLPILYGEHTMEDKRFSHCKPSFHVPDHHVLKNMIEKF